MHGNHATTQRIICLQRGSHRRLFVLVAANRQAAVPRDAARDPTLKDTILDKLRQVEGFASAGEWAEQSR